MKKVYQVRKMLKVGICDDEEEFILELKGYISEYSKENNVEILIQTYKNAGDLLSSIEKEGTLNIVFLDIQLKETSGVEVGRMIRSKLTNETIQIVFVSSKEGYAMQLFDIRPMNFLIKPIDYQKTKYILDEYDRLYHFHNLYFKYNIGKSHYIVNEQAILYFQSQGKKVHIITQKERKEFYGKLSDILLELKDKNFCMVHKSYIINMRYAVEYQKECVIMANGETIPVSRAMKKNLNRKLLENS